MATSAQIRQTRNLLLGLTLALLASSAVASSALAAASTTFDASFHEHTFPAKCPSGTPDGFTCYSGEGTGTATPPGGSASESFRSIVGPMDPNTFCAPDYSVAKITTSEGSLDLVARGTTCPTGPTTAFDQGTWKVIGGTGMFAGARGSGTFSTMAPFIVEMGKVVEVESDTTYAGTLTLSH